MFIQTEMWRITSQLEQLLNIEKKFFFGNMRIQSIYQLECPKKLFLSLLIIFFKLNQKCLSDKFL